VLLTLQTNFNHDDKKFERTAENSYKKQKQHQNTGILPAPTKVPPPIVDWSIATQNHICVFG